jgi:lysophospholipase L1-like esterase
MTDIVRFIRSSIAIIVVATAALSLPAPVSAQPAQLLAADATRYMALGDSIPAGYQALPVTNAYPYLLYGNGVFDAISHTLFCNAAVPGATSRHLLLDQVTQATIPAAQGGFNPAYVTVTIGGNDLLSILKFIQTHPNQDEVLQFANAVLAQYGQNLAAALSQLRIGLPNAKIFVANQYTVPEIEALVPLTAPLIAAFNGVVQQVVGLYPDHVYLVDVHAAFLGRQRLLLDERPGVSPFETHLTTEGHRVMAQAFADVIDQNR